MATDASPLITTIIPTYRRPQLLGRSIRSALAQTYPHLRVWVLDNASGDETADVVARLAAQDSRVSYLCHPQNIGSGANFIYGMRHVSTPYFSFVSDDDVLLPEFYQTAIGELTRFPDAIYFAGDVIQMTDTGEVKGAPIALWERDGYFAPPEGLFPMIGNKHPIMTGMVFRREFVEAFGVLDQDLTAADADLELRSAGRLPIVASRKPCAIFMLHAASLSVQSTLAFLEHDWPEIVRRITQDEGIPRSARERAALALTQHLRRETFQIGVKSAARRAFEDTRTAARILRAHYDAPDKARTLSLLADVCSRVPPAHWLLVLAYRLQHLRHRRSDSDLQAKYGAYAQYLDG
jgi:glycosyltransferase involved in cell wall biosynthesis